MFKVFRKFKSFFAVTTAIVMCFMLSGMSASANSDVTPPIGKGRCKNGIGNIHYYITDSVLNDKIGSQVVAAIDAAANSWVYTGYGYNPLYMYRTYDLYASNIDFRANDMHTEGYVRINVSYWQGTSANPIKVFPEESNWAYTEVEIFTTMCGSDPYKLRRFICKGIGHSLGLDENPKNPDSVMCDLWTPTDVYKPGIMDHNGLVAMYS